MAKSEEIKIEEIKRLLRRLDRALPPAPPASQTASDLASLQFETSSDEAQLPVVSLVRSSLSGVATARRESGPALAQVSNAATMRTVLLAAGVSAAVSGSIAFLVFNNSGPVMLTEAPSSPSAPARQPSPTSEAASIPPVVVPTPSEARRVAAAVPDIDAHQATEVAATPAPSETRPLETGSPEPPEPPKEAASQEPAPEPMPANKTDGQTLAALDASQFLHRGLNMLDSGNVSTAQLLLERAAELGNGQAAFALATTYDGAPGAPRSGSAVRPNVELAWRWYERAQELGIEGAQKRLDELKKGAASGG
jgi:hypothetical protein